jgi:hypothetical protein
VQKPAVASRGTAHTDGNAEKRTPMFLVNFAVRFSTHSLADTLDGLIAE